MLNFNGVILFSKDPAKLAEFYKKVFDKKPDWSGGDFIGFSVGSGWVGIGPHDKVSGKNKNPEMVIFQFEESDVKREFDRIKKAGAKVIAEPYQPSEEPDMWLATFEDVDGNYFQLATPMKM